MTKRTAKVILFLFPKKSFYAFSVKNILTIKCWLIGCYILCRSQPQLIVFGTEVRHYYIIGIEIPIVKFAFISYFCTNYILF